MQRKLKRTAGLFLGLCLWAPLLQASVLPVLVPGIPWIIERADYAGDIKDQIVRFEARYAIHLNQDGFQAIPLSVPGAVITQAKIEKKAGEAHIAAHDGSYVLIASKKGNYSIRLSFSQMLAQDSQFEGIRLQIPEATFSTFSLFVPRKDVELRPQDQLYVERSTDAQRGGIKLTAHLGASGQIDLRWRTKPAAPVKIEPVLYGEVHSLVSVEEQLVRLTSLVDYRISQGETRQLRLFLPAGLNVLNVRGAGIEDWRVSEAAGRKELAVSLNFALKDNAYRLVVESEQTLDAAATTYDLPEVELSGVKQERGTIAVARVGSTEVSPGQLQGIQRIDVKELPDIFRDSLGASATLAFKYHQHPFSASIALTRHEDHPVLAAIAERGELATIVSNQGELLTRAVYFIKANKKQFLEARLPEGAQLWSCLVDDRSVKPVKGAEDKLLISLDGVGNAESARVELVYFEQRPALSRLGQLDLEGPVLDVPTTIANWAVYAPQSLQVLRTSGNLERGAMAPEFIEEPTVPMVAASLGLGGAVSYDEPKDVIVAALDKARRKVSAKMGLLGDEREGDRGGRYEPYYASDASKEYRKGSQEQALQSPQKSGQPSVPAAGLEEDLKRLNAAGILPLQIRLPKSGKVHRFSRLMTTQDPLHVQVTFVRVPAGALAVILAMCAFSAMMILGLRLRRA